MDTAMLPAVCAGFAGAGVYGLSILTPLIGESFRLRIPGSCSSSFGFGLL